MAELPILPLKTDALLADTTHMTAEEFGAYCRILFVMWRQGGMLKDSEKELAKIAGVSMQKWKIISERVTRPLTRIGGSVSQKRLTETWLQVQEIRRKKAAASAARWGKKPMQADIHPQSGWNANQNQIDINTSSAERESDASQMQVHSQLVGSPSLKKLLRGRK